MADYEKYRVHPKNPRRLLDTWKCPERDCFFDSTWKPSIANHELTHTEEGRKQLKSRGSMRRGAKTVIRQVEPKSLSCPRCNALTRDLYPTINGRRVCQQCRRQDVLLGARILATDPESVKDALEERRQRLEAKGVEPTHAEMRDGCRVREPRVEGLKTRELVALRGGQRVGMEYPLWWFRWKPAREGMDVWFHSVIEARALSQARRFLESYAGGAVKVSHEGPATEESRV